MKRVAHLKYAVAAAAMLALLSLAEAKQLAISYLTHWAPETVAKLEEAAQRYSKDHPDVKITVRAVPFGDLLTTIRSQGGSADGPTIASIYDLWLPELVRDKLVDPAPAAVADEVKASWGASVGRGDRGRQESTEFPTRLISTRSITTRPCSRRPASRRRPRPGTNSNRMRRNSPKKGGRTTQQGFGLINSWAAGVVRPFASLLASNGGDLIVDGKPALDSKAAGETFALYEELIKKGYADPAMGTADANTTGPFLDNFVSGKTGMIIMANWWESALKAGMGDKFANIATAPIPVGPSGDAARSISYSWMTVVNAKAGDAEKAAAWDFLAWLDGPKSGPNGASAMSDILMSMGILPSRTSDIQAHKERLGARLPQGLCRRARRGQGLPGRARRPGVFRGAAAGDRAPAIWPGDRRQGAVQR